METEKTKTALFTFLSCSVIIPSVSGFKQRHSQNFSYPDYGSLTCQQEAVISCVRRKIDITLNRSGELASHFPSLFS